MKHPPHDPRPPLSPGRRRLFAAITLALPFLLLALLEAGLRAFEYGGDLRLVIESTEGGRPVYRINRRAAARYFAQAGTTVPEPPDESFAIVKKKNTRRIFCLGESTMAGFPYEFHATAPSLLRDRLQRLLPGEEIEVVNVGVSAVGSYVVEDFVRELLDYAPDLFIVYVGHNEFYGVYGEGSAVAVQGGPWLTRATIRLLRFKTFLLLRDLYAGALRAFAPAGEPADASLMGQMVGKGSIPYGSDEYLAAREVYRENLRRIIALARGRGVPVMFSALVSNLRHMPPFEPVFSPATPEARRGEITALLAEGDAALLRQSPAEALERFAAAEAADTLHARAPYGRGRALMGLGRFDEALRAFSRARDLDALRFRASGEFQQVLRDVCRDAEVPVSPVDSMFAAGSPKGITGHELILEHLHPTLDGYRLMARCWYETIRTRTLLVPAGAWADSMELSPAGWEELSRVAEFDRALGRVKTELLMRRWPFTKGVTNLEFAPETPEESVVFEYVQKRLTWSDARYRLAEYYAGRGEFGRARLECLAVAKVIPFSYQPLLRAADYYRAEGRNREATDAYRRAYEAEDNPYARIKRSIVLLEEDNAAEAERELLRAFALDGTSGFALPAAASSGARYLLSVAYAKQSNYPAAVRELERALAIDPANAEARDLLAQLKQHGSR